MLGVRLAQLRKAHGWNQAELAVQLGVSASAIGMYEQGRREPDCATLCALASLFDVSVDYLVTGHESTPDFTSLSAGFDQLLSETQSTLTLRAAGGVERPFGEKDLALLLAALFSAQHPENEP